MLGSLALAMSKVPVTKKNVRGVVHQIDALMMNRSICGRGTNAANRYGMNGLTVKPAFANI
jgi:hypothetical protein